MLGMMIPMRKLKDLSCYLLITLSFTTLIIYSSYSEPQHEKSISRKGSALSIPVLSPNNNRHSKTRSYCNSPSNIHLGHEGEVPSHYNLVGMVALMRHGDRGPLQNVPNISSINCGNKISDTEMYKQYTTDMVKLSKSVVFLKAIESFVHYPILPSPTQCVAGHLTPVGVMQHIRLGNLLKSIYVDKYSLLRYPWLGDDIEMHSTKFRRTFQSSLAFAYSFLPSLDLSQVKWRHDLHTTFCRNYCQCSKVSWYERKHFEEVVEDRKSHTGVIELIESLDSILQQNDIDKPITNPFVMRDALLVYACHGAKLPCNQNKCIQLDDLSKLLAFEEWQARQRQTVNKLKAAKLRAYGLLINIKNSIKRMVTVGKPKVILYFGHDVTINNLLIGLGLPYFQIPHYASRVILEVYANSHTEVWDSSSKDNFLFRIIYNGKDLTKLLPFCHAKLRKIPSESGKKITTVLCGLDNFYHFLNPKSYFKEFNTTNFFSACEQN